MRDKRVTKGYFDAMVFVGVLAFASGAVASSVGGGVYLLLSATGAMCAIIGVVGRAIIRGGSQDG